MERWKEEKKWATRSSLKTPGMGAMEAFKPPHHPERDKKGNTEPLVPWWAEEARQVEGGDAVQR